MPKDIQPRRKLVLLYSHADFKFVQRSRLLDFLRGIARETGLEFWWDQDLSRSLWDKEIRRAIDDAAAIVFLVSQPFLESGYIQHVETRLAFERVVKEGVCAVAVMYQPCLWSSHEWLQQVQRLPNDGYIYRRGIQLEVFYAVAIFLKQCLGYSRVFRTPEALYTTRSVTDSALLANQRAILLKDAIARADKLVPDKKLQRDICDAAKPLLAKNRGRPLGKAQLEELDQRFLARGKRKSDAENVRWVLRAHGLHPQGRFRA